MRLSVVIPVKDDFENIRHSVCILERSVKKPHEIIVIDDASSREIKNNLACNGLSLVRLENARGPAYARNMGARMATGDVIVFLDSDVFVDADTLQKIENVFASQEVDAVVGVFDESIKKTFLSDYKNLWMRYTYVNSPRRSSLFFTSVAAIKRDVFLSSGGFNERIAQPGIEDTLFGNVLWSKGIRPIIAPEITVLHNKSYNIITLFKTDFARSFGLTIMKLNGFMLMPRKRSATSIPRNFTISVLCVLIGSSFFLFRHDYLIGNLLLLVAILLNTRFLIWIYRKRGLLFLSKAVIFLVIDYPVIIVGMFCGLLGFLFRSEYAIKLNDKSA